MIVSSFFESDCTENNFKIMHLNARSLRKKLDELEIIVNEQKFDVCCFSETYFKDEEINVRQIEGYTNASHFCRKNRLQGGVSIYVKNSVNFTKI